METIQLDLPSLAGAFSRRLHEAGVPVTPARSAAFADALALVRPISRRRLYWTCRAVFVTDPLQVKAFDAVFSEVFGARDADTTFEPENLQFVTAPAEEQPMVDHKTMSGDPVSRDFGESMSAAPPSRE